jgi:hypothetical protein
MLRTLPLVAALLVGALGTSPAAASSPKPRDFELTAPGTSVSGAGAAREYVSPKLRAPGRFNLVGLRWRGGAAEHTHLRVRVKRDGGHWTKWRELEATSAEGPDAGSGERVATGISAPAWAGQADWVQYRSDRRLPGAKLHFVKTIGTVHMPKTVRSAGAGQPPMVSRDGWGAQDCPPRAAPDYGEVKMAFVHHTVNLNDYSREEAPAVVLGICRFHRNSNGWNDIGYNFLVDKYGTLYEGRAGGVDQPIIGAQAQGFNSVSTGIANIGTFEDVPQSNEALDAMARLIRWKLPLHGAPTAGTVQVTSAGGDSNRFAPGTVVTMNRISGHRDGNNTSCPGSALYAQLPELRRRVGSVAPTNQGTTNGVGRAATRLAASPPAIIAYPQVARVTGNLRTSGGGQAGLPVELQRQATDGSFKTIVRGTTGAGGSFALTFNPSKRAVVRVRFAGDADNAASESRPATINVRPVLTWTRPPSRVAPKALIQVPGTIAPRKSSVRLIVVRKSGKGRKGVVASVPARASSGKYTAQMRIQNAGLYRMRVIFAGDNKNLAIYGKWFYVRVAKGAGGTAPAPPASPETTTPTPPPSNDGAGGTAAQARR